MELKHDVYSRTWGRFRWDSSVASIVLRACGGAPTWHPIHDWETSWDDATVTHGLGSIFPFGLGVSILHVLRCGPDLPRRHDDGLVYTKPARPRREEEGPEEKARGTGRCRTLNHNANMLLMRYGSS